MNSIFSTFAVLDAEVVLFEVVEVLVASVFLILCAVSVFMMLKVLISVVPLLIDERKAEVKFVRFV